MFEFFASLAWWEWLMLVPCVIVVAWCVFSAIMYTIAMFVLSFLTKPEFAGWVVTITILSAFSGLALIIARHH